MNLKYIFDRLLVATTLLLATYCISNSIMYLRNFEKSVEVKGVSEKIVLSDYASWNISYSVSGNNLFEIESIVSKNQKNITNILKQNGLSEHEIQIGTNTVTDNWANQYNPNFAQMQHYQISSTIIVNSDNIKDISNANNNLNQLIKTGLILSTNNINYFYKNLNLVKNDMLLEATQNAKNSANIFASNSNSQVLGIKNANQGLFTISSPDGSNLNDTQNIYKKIRVVTTVNFFIK